MKKLRLKQKDDETIKDELKRRIADYKEMAHLIRDAIVPAIRRYDGRVLNKTLCTYMERLAQNCCFMTQLRGKNLYCDKVVYTWLIDKNNPFLETTFNIPIKTRTIEGSKSLRINADETIDMEYIVPQIGEYEQKARQLEEIIENFGSYMEMQKKLQSEIDRWNNVPYDFLKTLSFDIPEGLF